MGGPDSFWEATWLFPAERTFGRGISGLESGWEASCPFPTGRTLGLGILEGLSRCRVSTGAIVCLYTLTTGRFKQLLGRITKNVLLM